MAAVLHSKTDIVEKVAGFSRDQKVSETRCGYCTIDAIVDFSQG
jgi:hypothetical protein